MTPVCLDTSRKNAPIEQLSEAAEGVTVLPPDFSRFTGILTAGKILGIAGL
jgi:hypothetical protein